MTESTHTTGGPPDVVTAARSGLTALKTFYGDGGGDSDSKDGDSPATNYGYGDDIDVHSLSLSDSEEEDFPGDIYGDDSDDEDSFPAYGYGDDDDDDKGDDCGYGEDKDAGSPADDYGYGDEAAPSQPSLSTVVQPARLRSLRRNSCLIRKEHNPLAVAEYLLGGPPRMSDRDMTSKLNNEGAMTA
jgi:hypothetical protein